MCPSRSPGNGAWPLARHSSLVRCVRATVLQDNPDRTASRHRSEAGSATLSDRLLPAARPRMRTACGVGEVPLLACELFDSTELLSRMAMETMLAGLSTRRSGVGLEPVGQQVTGSSKVTVLADGS